MWGRIYKLPLYVILIRDSFSASSYKQDINSINVIFIIIPNEKLFTKRPVMITEGPNIESQCLITNRWQDDQGIHLGCYTVEEGENE